MSKGCYEVRGKTLGIVGYGHIGSQVGVLAEMLGMKVKFFDIASKVRTTMWPCSQYRFSSIPEIEPGLMPWKEFCGELPASISLHASVMRQECLPLSTKRI